MRWTILAALTIAAAPADAAPTYLACVIDAETGPWPLQLAMDEERQTVMLSAPKTGATSRWEAAYTPTAVSFGDRTTGYLVSRTDLSIKRTLTIGAKAWEDGGTCKVEAVPARAF